MRVVLGHAVCSETGGKYGEPGDQTGKELRFQDWYLRDKGWKGVFRWKDEKLGEQAASYVRDCVNSVHVGYSQSGESDGRESLDREASKYDYNIDVLVTDVNCDCSSLVASAVRSVGGKVDRGMYTGNEEEQLKKSGLFTEYKSKDYTESPDKLKVGDILWGDGHTATVVEVIKDKEETKPSEKVNVKFQESCILASTLITLFSKDIEDQLGIKNIDETKEAKALLAVMVDKLKDKYNVVKEVPCTPFYVRFRKPFRLYAGMTGDRLNGSGVAAGVYTVVALSSDELRGKLKSGSGWVKLEDAEIIK